MMSKMWIKCLIMTVLCTLSINSLAYASNLDEYGNEIDWDLDEVGNEEGAGSEENYVPINADLLDSERLEQSEGEAESIADVINQNRVNESDIENGTVSLRFAAPDEWRGSNVVVSLYNKDLWKSFDVYIYKQNGFEGQEELPCGEYEVRGASVVGDTNRVYPLLVDANGRESFKLEQGGEKIVINVELAGTNGYIKETENDEAERETAEVIEEKAEETSLKKAAKGFLWDNMIFVALLIIGLAGFALYKIKSDKDEDID